MRARRAKKVEPKLGEVHLPPLLDHTLSNGLRLVVARREPIPLVSARLVLAAGAAVDPPERRGLADFTARLLRRGARSLTADQLNDAVEFVGAALSVGAAEDFSALSLTTPAAHLDAMLDVAGQILREPIFPEQEVETMRRRQLAQLANDLDDPGLVADRALGRALWGTHPYGHDVGGVASDVERFTRADVEAFHRAWYGPHLAQFFVVGAVDPDRVLRAVEHALGSWKGGAEFAPQIPSLDRAAGAGRVLLVDKPDQTQSQVRIGRLAMRRGAPGWIPALVMNTTLGGGFTSRLVNEIRVNRGLSYGAGSGFDGMLAGGSFQISSFTKTESTSELIKVALAEAAKMRGKGPTSKELSVAQTYMAGLYPLRLETNESVAAAIAEMRLYGLGDDWVSKYRERVRAVTRDEAASAARQWLPDDEPAIVVLGNAAKVKRQLTGFGALEVVPIGEVS